METNGKSLFISEEKRSAILYSARKVQAYSPFFFIQKKNFFIIKREKVVKKGRRRII
jgi:hypothetical protein